MQIETRTSLSFNNRGNQAWIPDLRFYLLRMTRLSGMKKPRGNHLLIAVLSAPKTALRGLNRRHLVRRLSV